MPQVTASDIKDNEATIDNIRLWRRSVILENYQSLQRIRSYYEFRDVDVDRYTLDGERRVVMMSGREVSQAGIQVDAQTWQNEHLVYTHGYGAVSALVNQATAEGAPSLTLADIPVRSDPGPELSQPRIYFGEGSTGDTPFVVVGTKTAELDYEGSTAPYAYNGTGGIPMGNPLQRALFAWRFRDVNLLISGQITSTSRIMIYRDIAQRVPKPVPFLTFDQDPYFAVSAGRPVWIWDAYTTTNQYPYSQSLNLSEATDGQLPPQLVNYMRNSVKAVTDAYDGTMTYYANLSDPIIQVWDRAFPGLLTPIEDAPTDLQEHFRYPENIFQTQATQFANYHVTDAQVFYQKQDRWEIPADPTVGLTTTGTAPVEPIAPTTTSAARLRPYYLLMKAPGDTVERFQLVLPFVPEGRQNMVAWMTANSDPGPDYGRMLALELPDGANVDGPSVVFSRINQNPQFSAERTLLGQGGSQMLFGDFLVIPMSDSFLYIQPVYVRSNQTTSVPELKRVVVANGDSVGVGNTLQEALAESVKGQVDTGGGEPGGGGGGNEQTVNDLLNQALDHFQAAQDALTAGNLALYQSELDQAQQLVEQANELAGQQADGATGATRSDRLDRVAQRQREPQRQHLVGQAEREVGFHVGDVHLRLLQVTAVVPVHRLPFRELIQDPHTGLPRAVAALAVAAEGQVGLSAAGGVVDAHHAGRDPLAEPERVQRIARVDAAREAVPVAVRQGHRLVEVAERRHPHDRPERLGRVEGVLARDAIHDRRVVEEPGPASPTNPSRGLPASIRPVPVEPSTR